MDVGIEKKENRRDKYDPRELSSEPEEYGHKTRPIAERHEDGMAGLTDRFVERCEPVSRDPDLPLFRLTARSIIIGELRFFFARRGLNGCLGRLGHACRVLLGRGNHLHNPDLVGTKGVMVL